MRRLGTWLSTFNSWVDWNKKTNIFLGVLVGLVLLAFIIKLMIKGSNDGVVIQPLPTTQEESVPKEHTNIVQPSPPPMPCMEDDPNLVFAYAVPDVTLRKGEEYKHDRPYGHEAKWCVYGGKIRQISHGGETQIILKGITDEPALVRLRFYFKKH